MTNRVRILLDHTPFPGAGEDFGGHKVIESVMDVSGRNWEIHLKGSLSKSQVKEAVSELTAAPFALPVEDDYSLVEFRAKGMTHVRTNPPGNATVVRGHMYYARPNPITPSQFQVEMDEMLIDNPEEHFVKHSAPTDSALKKKLWSFVTYTGESYGWYKGGEVYHRRASIIMPKIKINKALEGATMFYHTHPAKDEPSLTSADDIQFYLDLHFAWGIKTFYTVMKHKMDKFTITAKPGGKEKYLRMEEEAFVDAVDALIGKGEEKAEKEVKKEAPETDYQNAVTAEMVRQFNKKYSSIAKISFRPSVKKASAAAAAAKESPRYLWGARSNPGPNPPIKPEQKYMASALNELKGLDYAYEHYGGDEYAHTMYVYWWMRHHFMPTPQHKAGRLYKLQPFGLDSEARGQLRSYLSTTIAGSWTYLDAMFIIGLYHDIAKLREKSDSRHHSTIGAEMFLQEIQAELNLPSQVAEDIAHVLSTDVGRRGIDDETFRAQVGDYYGVAKLMQMADVYTHHPFMFTNSARAAKERGAIEYSDGQMYKDYVMTELVDDIKEFLDAYARPNPPPVPVFVKWRGSYNRGNFDMDIVEATLEDFDQRNVPDQDGKTGDKQGGSGGHLFYMRFNQTHVSSIPEGTVVKASLALRTGVLLVDVSNPPADAGLQYAQEIYELVGTELQASFPDVEVEVVEPEPMVNPRKAARIQVITLSGPSGSGKSTVLRHLLKSIPDAAAPPTYTTRPRRPTDGNDRRFMTKAEFMDGIRRGDFAEWYQAGSGHFYGRKLEDFLGSYAIVDVSFRGMEYYRNLFPNTHTVFLAPDPKISVKERAKKLYKRGGISKEEAMRRAKVGRQMAIDAKKYNFDVTVQMKDGEYTKGANKVLESIPRDNPVRSVPWREITEEDAARVAAVRQAEYSREGEAWNEKTRRLIDSTNWMAIEGTHNDFNNYPRAHKAPSWYNSVQGDDRKYGVVMKKPGKTLFDFNPIVEVPPVLGGDEENAPTVDDEPLSNPPISELMSEVDRTYVDQVKDMVKLVSPFYMDNDGRIMGVFEVPVVMRRDDDKVGVIGTNRLLFYTRTGEGTPEEKAQEILDDPDTTNYDLIAESPSLALHGLGDDDWDSLVWSCMLGVNRGRGFSQWAGWYIKPEKSSFLFDPFDGSPTTTPPFAAAPDTWEEKFTGRFGHRTMYYASLAIRELYPDKDTLIDLSLSFVDLYNMYNLRGRNRDLGYAINLFLDEHKAVRSKHALLPETHSPRPNPSKDLLDWFTEWVHLINMKNKELKAFLDSPLGKKAGLSKEEADAQGIKSGRVSGRRILKMRAKLGLTGPKDYIKIGPRIIESYYEKALKEWTGPSDDALDGETDWDWCKRQVRFVKRHGAFPYNANQKGPLVREQKTQNQVSRRLLGLWVWGHDPWRWARKHGVAKMPKCPDVPWIGMTEKRKYGKVEVKMNPHYTPTPGISMFPGELHQGPAALYQQTVSITQLTNPPEESLAEDWAYEQPNPRTPGGKKVPTRYLKGLTKLERMIAEDEIDKGYEYDTDDPEAYKFWKSDIKATARGLKIGPSKHKEEYYRRYRKNIDSDYKPSGNTPKRKFVNRITKETGIKRSLIEKVYNKGLAAWRTGHRPGVQQHQWAAGRVYAFAVGADSSTGPGKPDHSLAVEAGVRKNPKVPFEENPPPFEHSRDRAKRKKRWEFITTSPSHVLKKKAYKMAEEAGVFIEIQHPPLEPPEIKNVPAAIRKDIESWYYSSYRLTDFWMGKEGEQVATLSRQEFHQPLPKSVLDFCKNYTTKHKSWENAPRAYIGNLALFSYNMVLNAIIPGFPTFTVPFFKHPVSGKEGFPQEAYPFLTDVGGGYVEKEKQFSGYYAIIKMLEAAYLEEQGLEGYGMGASLQRAEYYRSFGWLMPQDVKEFAPYIHDGPRAYLGLDESDELGWDSSMEYLWRPVFSAPQTS